MPSPPLTDRCRLSASIPAGCRIAGRSSGMEQWPPPDFGTAVVIEDQILTSIRNFEPRVENVRVDVIPRPDDNNFEVTVIFDIVGQEFPTQEYTFILEATR